MCPNVTPGMWRWLGLSVGDSISGHIDSTSLTWHKAGLAALPIIRTTCIAAGSIGDEAGMTIWEKITVLGGLPVTGLIALAIACSLFVASSHPWRAPAYWCALFAAALAIAAGSQIAFLGWGIGVEAFSFAGFSGHATRAAAVFPVALFILFMRCGRWVQTLAVLTGFGGALLIALSRVQIGAHSVAEASAGFTLGAVVASAFMWHARRSGSNRLAIPLIALCLTAAMTSGQPGPETASITHQWMVGIALNLSGRDRPYSRADWRLAPAPYVPPCALASIRFHYLCL